MNKQLGLCSFVAPLLFSLACTDEDTGRLYSHDGADCQEVHSYLTNSDNTCFYKDTEALAFCIAPSPDEVQNDAQGCFINIDRGEVVMVGALRGEYSHAFTKAGFKPCPCHQVGVELDLSSYNQCSDPQPAP